MFGFAKVPHKDFKNNFLKTVVFQVVYDNKNIFPSKKEGIVDFFVDKFPRVNTSMRNNIHVEINNKSDTPILQHTNEEDGLLLKSDDGQKTLSISNNSLTLSITGKAYRNYESIKEDVKKIHSFFEFCEINSLKRVSIRKINIIEFEGNDDKVGVLELLINNDLLGNLEHFPEKNNINHNIQSLSYAIEDYDLNIKYGLVMGKQNKELGQVIVDIDLLHNTMIECNKIYDIADGINSEIFNIFNWVVSEETINMLENETRH